MIPDLLLDINIVVDICARRHPYFVDGVRALDKAITAGVRLWIYTGSVQTLEYVTAIELRRITSSAGQVMTFDESHHKARQLLALFWRGKQCLSALAEDGDVWTAGDPEDAQLCRAVQRLGKEARLLTRDDALLKDFSDAISTRAYLNLESVKSPLSFIDLARQQDHLRPSIESRMHRVLHHGNYIMGPEVKELEEKLAGYVGAKHAIGCASGTDALLLALMTYKVGPGDAIFTTPFTFIATAEVISLLGATPIFVDIDPKTLNIDPAKLELAIQALKSNDPTIHPLPRSLPLPDPSLNSPNSELRTSSFIDPSPVTRHPSLSPRGIIAVDLFGLPADYNSINSISQKFNLFVIEDAAQSFGAEYKEKKACSLADIACTSFFPAKPLGCYGDGGMCFTDDNNLAEVIRSLRVHGKGGHKYDNIRIGINGRLDTLQAAILLAKFEIFPEEITLRQQVANRYNELLSNFPDIILPIIQTNQIDQPTTRSAWAQYSILASGSEERDKLMERLKAANIPTAIYYPKPLHLQTAFANLGYKEGDFPASEDAANRIFSLPMHPYLAIEDQKRIAELFEIK